MSDLSYSSFRCISLSPFGFCHSQLTLGYCRQHPLQRLESHRGHNFDATPPRHSSPIPIRGLTRDPIISFLWKHPRSFCELDWAQYHSSAFLHIPVVCFTMHFFLHLWRLYKKVAAMAFGVKWAAYDYLLRNFISDA